MKRTFQPSNRQAQTYPWVQGTYGDKGRPSRAQAPASEGARAAHTLEAFVSVRPSATFSRRKRLTLSREFGRVFAHPVRSTDAYFTVLARPGTCDNPRLGLAISKRVCQNGLRQEPAATTEPRDLSLPGVAGLGFCRHGEGKRSPRGEQVATTEPEGALQSHRSQGEGGP